MASLVGNWSFRRMGSDQYEGLHEIPGVPPCALMCTESSTISISISNDGFEELQFRSTIKNNTPPSSSTIDEYLQIGKLAFFDIPQCDPPSTITVVHCSPDFKEFSYLVLGPGKEQRSLVHMVMDTTGQGFRADLQMKLPVVREVKLVKYFSRISSNSDISANDTTPTSSLKNAYLACNWIRTSTTSSEVGNVQIEVVESCDLNISETGFTWAEDAQKSRYKQAIPPLKHLKGVCKEGSGQYFAIKVQYMEYSWFVLHRYSEFVCFHSFLLEQLQGKHTFTIPDLPKKTYLGKPTGVALQKRKEALNDYLNALIEEKGFHKVNIVEALYSFLEIPENLGRFIVSVEDDQLSTPYQSPKHKSNASTPGEFPQDVLHACLSQGVHFLKHSRSRFKKKPEKRILKCNTGVTTLYWEDANDDTGTKVKRLHVSDITAVVAAIDTSTKKLSEYYKGKAKAITRDDLTKCFTIVTNSRNLDIQCLNEEDFDNLYSNLKKLIAYSE